VFFFLYFYEGTIVKFTTVFVLASSTVYLWQQFLESNTGF